jgi:hypothetical protein
MNTIQLEGMLLMDSRVLPINEYKGGRCKIQ